MKLNKTFGRIATTLVATAMLASVTAVPAFATDGIQGGTNTTINSLSITKKLDMPDNVVTSEDVTFTFNLTPATADTNETITSSGVSLDVSNGMGQVLDATAVFKAGAKNGNTASVVFNFGSDFTFSNPGVYKYTIDEEEVKTANGYSDVTESLDVYLFVRKTDTEEIDTSGNSSDGYVIYAAVVATDSSASDKTSDKTGTWVNGYMTGATGSLAVKKEIAGTMASPNDEFTFTVSGLDANRTYVVSGADITADNNTITTNDKGEYQFTLQANETRTILGLTAKEYVVIETPSNEGYELAEVKGDKDSDDTEIKDGVNVTLESGDMDKSVTFVNNRDAVSPTGLVMDIAPYALLVVVAAAGCFVFLRKRRED